MSRGLLTVFVAMLAVSALSGVSAGDLSSNRRALRQGDLPPPSITIDAAAIGDTASEAAGGNATASAFAVGVGADDSTALIDQESAASGFATGSTNGTALVSGGTGIVTTGASASAAADNTTDSFADAESVGIAITGIPEVEDP